MDRPRRLLSLLLATLVASAPVLAAPPPWAGGAKKDGVPEPVGEGSHFASKPLPPGVYFDDRNRELVHRYYQAHPLKPCPPGLAKKHNGCLPPGQAKKWAIGQPLPADVVVQPVPRAILVDLPKLPPAHEYVQVGGDILLIAIGSKMVVDGINGMLAR